MFTIIAERLAADGVLLIWFFLSALNEKNPILIITSLYNSQFMNEKLNVGKCNNKVRVFDDKTKYKVKMFSRALMV